jgi:hypothetical protein
MPVLVNSCGFFFLLVSFVFIILASPSSWALISLGELLHLIFLRTLQWLKRAIREFVCVFRQSMFGIL